jgi:hypothetical protein
MADKYPSAINLLQAFTAVGFAVQALHSIDEERTYSIIIPKHQVEWLRTYGIIQRCEQALFGRFGVGLVNLMYCEVVFTLKDLESTFPKPDID